MVIMNSFFSVNQNVQFIQTKILCKEDKRLTSACLAVGGRCLIIFGCVKQLLSTNWSQSSFSTKLSLFLRIICIFFLYIHRNQVKKLNQSFFQLRQELSIFFPTILFFSSFFSLISYNLFRQNTIHWSTW